MKIAVVGHIHKAAMATLNEIDGCEITQTPDGSENQIEPAVRGARAILLRTSKLTPALLDQAPDLRVVSRHGVGYDNVPLDYLNERGLPLAVSASANMVSVAEHAIFMMLHLAKNASASDHAVRHEEWRVRNRLDLFELAGSTLLIVGFGRIGRQVAKRAKSFDMQILVFDPFVGDDPIEAAGCARAAVLEEAVAMADIVSLHLPVTPETRNMFDTDMIALMKESSLLINTARGGLIDETALADALRLGRIRGAGLDVLEQEPPQRGHPLFACDNLVLSPHMAGVTRQSMMRMGMEAAVNIIDVLNGKFDPNVIVNFDAIKT